MRVESARPLTAMSESAAIIKVFFRSIVIQDRPSGYTTTAGAEDKPLLGSKLSADSGAKTRLGGSGELSPSGKLISLGWHQRDKSHSPIISCIGSHPLRPCGFHDPLLRIADKPAKWMTSEYRTIHPQSPFFIRATNPNRTATAVKRPAARTRFDLRHLEWDRK